MKVRWLLGILALLGLPCSAQQIMYSNLKALVEGRGDTVTILKVEKRSKNQIYLMGRCGLSYRGRRQLRLVPLFEITLLCGADGYVALRQLQEDAL